MTARSLAMGIQLRSGVIQVCAALLVIGYLAMMLELSASHWVEFGWGGLIVCVLSGLAWPFTQKPIMKPVLDVARALQSAAPPPEVARAGLAGACALPPRLFFVASVSWVLAALIVPGWMAIRLPDLPVSILLIVATAALGGGLLSCIAAYFAVKRLVGPLRDRCASAVPDADERAALVLRIPLALKLGVASTAIVAVALFFLIQLAWTETSRPLEAQVVALQARYLEGLADQARPDLARAREELARFGIAEGLVELPREGAAPTGTALTDTDLAFVRAGGASGDSRGLFSDNAFAWATLGDGEGPVVVALTSWSSLRGGLLQTQLRYLGVMVGAILASFAISALIASDVVRSLEQLRQRAAAVAAGDLTDRGAFESEDEMGDLGREVDRMLVALRETLERVGGAAGRVDAGASAMAGIGERVNEASAAQARALEQAAREVASIDREIGGIKDSAHALTGNVEEASSSILELGAAGEELNHTASALTKQIENVSGSIEQMIISSRQISENTDGLAEEVAGTSESMSEMAASMDAVDRSANETAALSEQVSELAGRGRDRVRETIEGMDDIRGATDTLSQTIGGLDSRIQEIGAIVDVIDDVADETNLLALNAAIIAAQAGDQGRAFSVVADEIKDLADRVLRSTKEIGGLIRAVQSESANAARAIARGSESVQRGVELAAEAGVSLEEITGAATTSRERIRGIVAAVQDQARAASHVVSLMERVNLRVEEIRRAGSEQERGNEVIMRGSLMMRDVAQQTHRTTEEQARGARQVRSSIEGIQSAVEAIHRSLEGQAGASRSAVASLQRVHEQTASNREATEQMSQATEDLRVQAQTLRDDVGRFSIRKEHRST